MRAVKNSTAWNAARSPGSEIARDRRSPEDRQAEPPLNLHRRARAQCAARHSVRNGLVAPGHGLALQNARDPISQQYALSCPFSPQAAMMRTGERMLSFLATSGTGSPYRAVCSR